MANHPNRNKSAVRLRAIGLELLAVSRVAEIMAKDQPITLAKIRDIISRAELALIGEPNDY